MKINRKRKIECRVTNSEYLVLKKKAASAGITLSELIRGTALNYELANKLTCDEIACYKQLTSLKNNFQNISNYMKYKANRELLDEIINTIELVNQHLKKF
ncbi:plasmid mobilization protein [Sunxiuqinia elliptica]